MVSPTFGILMQTSVLCPKIFNSMKIKMNIDKKKNHLDTCNRFIVIIKDFRAKINHCI